MPDNSRNTSFIPKRGPARRSRSTASRQVYLFTLVSYVLFFATLAAAGGVFLYGRYIDSQMNNSVTSLNNAIAGFSEEEMARVQAFDKRLKEAEKQLDQSISIADLLEYMELATAESSSYSELRVQRENSESLAVVASIESDSFDSTLFQRESFESAGLADNVSVTDVVLGSGSADGSSGLTTVQFTATLAVPSSAVPYTVEDTTTVTVPEDQGTTTEAIETEEVIEGETDTDSLDTETIEESNETEL